MAISLSKQGVAIEVIAQAAGVAKEVVKQWLIPASAQHNEIVVLPRY